MALCDDLLVAPGLSSYRNYTRVTQSRPNPVGFRERLPTQELWPDGYRMLPYLSLVFSLTLSMLYPRLLGGHFVPALIYQVRG